MNAELYLIQTPSRVGLDYILSHCYFTIAHNHLVSAPYSTKESWLRIVSIHIIIPVPTSFPSSHYRLSYYNLGDRIQARVSLNLIVSPFHKGLA